MDNLTELYCHVDDFFVSFDKQLKAHSLKTKGKKTETSALSPSEVMTILILFHQIPFRNFKSFYRAYVLPHLSKAFPKLVSYSRFVELIKASVLPLLGYLFTYKSVQTGIAFVDSTSLDVCHIRRSKSHKVFKGLAKKGKTSVGWFFGFKLHLCINDQGEILSFHLSPGNTDDRVPVPKLTKGLWGKLVGDKGYLCQALFEELFQQGLTLITKIKKNMKNKLMPFWNKLLLRKRAIIESVIDQLKNISQIEHSRHRSPTNFVANLLAGLVAYQLKPKKPSLHVDQALELVM